MVSLIYPSIMQSTEEQDYSHLEGRDGIANQGEPASLLRLWKRR